MSVTTAVQHVPIERGCYLQCIDVSVETAVSVCGAIATQVTSSMSGVVKAMESAMKSMNLEKVSRHDCLIVCILFIKSSIGASHMTLQPDEADN